MLKVEGRDDMLVGGRKSKSSPEESIHIDQHIGTRIRQRRLMLGLTQQQLAALIGVTYQQAHKYERGVNRVSAGRLFQIANALNVSTSFFYEGLSEEEPAPMASHERMTFEIARNVARITNEHYREALSRLARVLAAPQH